MSDSINRRDFIRTASLFGTSLALPHAGSSDTFLPGNLDHEIKNDFFSVSFDRGKFHVSRINGTKLIANAIFCVNTEKDKIFFTPDRYKSNSKSGVFNNAVGAGRTLVINCSDKHNQLDLEFQISLYDKIENISFELICKNVSKKDYIIKSLEPVRIVADKQGSFSVPGVSKCITNGEMYFDAGKIYEFDDSKSPDSNESTKGVNLVNKNISQQYDTIHSWWNIGLFSGYDRESIAIGYLENQNCLGNLLVARTATDQISFLAESVYAPQMLLRPGNTVRSNRVGIFYGQDVYASLEAYADAISKTNHARTKSIVNGWCSWFYTLAKVSESEVISNTAFAAKHLKKYGLEYIQIDEGYQRWHGEWEGNERFPRGMKWLAAQIKSEGFKAGIWISPYVISEPTEVFQKHPEWLVKNKDGSLQRVGNWPENTAAPADENPKRYCLDITHPEAAQWFRDLIHMIAQDWGYEMIKIDFVAWSILAAKQFHDPTLSAAQVYRKGMEMMREAAGEKCHILECGPGAVTTGLIDSMRIELDINYGFADAAWNTYFLDPACSASAMAYRYYFHKRTWINDADHICLDLLNIQQSQAVTSLIALSGGNMMSGDRLTQLDPAKLELLKKITPSFGDAAFPVDLFDSNRPNVFALPIKKSFGSWTIVGAFNSSLTETIEKKFPAERFRLENGKSYLVFDFWNQNLIGDFSNELKISIQPGSVSLLSIHEKKGHPQFLSTDRHVLQGALELEEVRWEENTKKLNGVSIGPLNTSHNVFVYVPEKHPWSWGGNALYQDYESYSLKLVGEQIIRVNVQFDKVERIEWEIDFEKFFK